MWGDFHVGEQETIDLEKGDQIVMRYSAIQSLIVDGTLDII